MSEEKLYIGIDLGGTKIFTGLVNPAGELLSQDYRKTKAKRGVDSVVQRIIDSVAAVREHAGETEIQAIGIGAPGPVEPVKGMVVGPPNLPGWQRVPLRQMIETALDIPTYLENDANAAALAEHRFGAGRGAQHMLYVTVSTGIGGGLIINGQLYGGATGSAAEVGHMIVLPEGPHCGCGNRGCLEAVASGTAIAREGRELVLRGIPTLIADLSNADAELVTAKVVADAAQQGDVEAREIISKAMSYLGVGIASLVNILGPELIVIGGSLTKLGEILFDPVRRAVAKRAFPLLAQTVKIVPAELGDEVGVLGAAAVAMLPFVQSY